MTAIAPDATSEQRHSPAPRRLAPWLLLSLVLHAGAMQWAPRGTPWGCCGETTPQSGTDRTLPALLVRLTGSGAGVPAAVPAEKTEPIQTARSSVEDDPAASMKKGVLPHYFAPGELDRKPAAGTDIRIAGEEALAGTAPGRVVLALFINETGGMDDVHIESATLPAAFQDRAREAFLKSRFTPGYRDGMPVKSRLRIEVTVEEDPATMQRTGLGPSPTVG